MEFELKHDNQSVVDKIFGIQFSVWEERQSKNTDRTDDIRVVDTGQHVRQADGCTICLTDNRDWCAINVSYS